jgi:hypothetical protein
MITESACVYGKNRHIDEKKYTKSDKVLKMNLGVIHFETLSG